MTSKTMERVTGIEPAWPAWKAGALPLSYTRVTKNSTSRAQAVPIPEFLTANGSNITLNLPLGNHA